MTNVSVHAIVENRGVDVEFAVAAGEVLAVLGPNGAGKSTALHVIAGLVQPDTGVVRVGDRVLSDTSTGT
jgi:molybdate transport system ATP-binding protein